jgi:AbiTii
VSLLSDIQEGAADDRVSVASLLRKVKVLSSRLGVQDVGNWADKELAGGYESGNDLPPYRGPFNADVRGDVLALGPFGGGYQNYPVPPLMFSEDIRSGALFKLFFFQGMAELEDLASRAQDLQEPWPSDALAMIDRLQEGGVATWDRPMRWVEIHKVITRSTIVGVIDAVRNRLLEFTLQLETVEPAAARNERASHPDRVLQVFNTTVYAGAANVAVGSRNIEQNLSMPPPGDEDGLLSYLQSAGLAEEWLKDLRLALADDRDNTPSTSLEKGPGRKVLAWLKRLSSATAATIGSGVATGVVTEAVIHYFGI